MPNWKKVIVSGSDAALNTLTVSNGITGSLLGTSSFASTASFVNPLNQNVVITGSASNSLTVRGSGATSATNALYIENSSATTALTVRDDGLISVMPNNSNITIDGSTANGGRIIVQSPNSNARIGINSYNTFLYPTELVLYARSAIKGATNVLGDLRFYNLTTGKTYMFMTETGLISINKGTVTPNAELDVSGSVIITGSLTVMTGSNVELQVLNTGVRLGNVSTDTHTATGSFNVSGSFNVIGQSVFASNPAGTVGDVAQFYAGVRSIFIRSTNNESTIGNTAGGLGNLISFSGAGNAIGFQAGAVTRMFLNDTGLVIGDGLTSPNAKLHVNGNTQITGSATNSLLVKGSGTTSATNALRIENSAGSSGLIVNDIGKVAIGTNITPNTSNVYDLTTSYIIAAYMNNSRYDIAGVNFGSYPGGGIFNIGESGWTGRVNYSTFNILSNVGINKTSPNANLDVSGSVIITGSVSNSLRVRGSGTTSATNTLRIENSNTTASFIVRDDGNVAINNTSPGSLLTLNTSFATTNGLTISSDDSSDAQIVIRRAASKPVLGLMAFDTATYISNGVYYDGGNWIHHSDGNDNSILVFDPGVGASWFASNNGAGSWNVASNITLWDSTSYWKSLVQSTFTGDSYFTGGNVGIGTASPSTKLHVDGTVRIDNQNSSTPTGPNVSAGTVSNYWGAADGTFLSTPNTWLKINLSGNDYYLPAYS